MRRPSPSPCPLRAGTRVGSRRAYGRDESESDPRDAGDQQSEQEHSPIGRDVEPEVDGQRRLEPGDDASEPVGQDHGGRPTGQRQHHALCQHLPNQATLPGAKRVAKGELTLTRRGAGQHHVGQVRARHQQHQSHRAEKHHARRRDRRVQIGVERDIVRGEDSDSLALVGLRVLGLQPRRDVLQLGPNLRDRDVRLHPPLDPEEMLAAPLQAIGSRSGP